MASRKLFPVRFEISPGDIAATPKTRFRFIQRSFTAARDGWALDNVRILRYLPDDWAVQAGFLANVQYTLKWMQRAQCCFDTDWCETRLTLKEMDECDSLFEWYGGRHYFIRGAELYVVICVFSEFVQMGIHVWV